MATETSNPASRRNDDTDMPTALINHPRAWLATSLVAAALLLAACGGGSSTSSSSTAAASSTATSSASSSSPSASGASGIPQGPKAGDQDADNQGGPTDGDGNI
jgi:hypothetical protein